MWTENCRHVDKLIIGKYRKPNSTQVRTSTIYFYIKNGKKRRKNIQGTFTPKPTLKEK